MAEWPPARGGRLGLLGPAVALALVLIPGTATQAWATFKASSGGTTAIAAHGMVTPSQPTCGGLGVASVRLSWTAPSDASQADVYGSGFLAAGYQVGKSSSSSGPFTYVDNGTATSYDASTLLAGDTYFVVRTSKQSWHSASSPVRLVHVTLGLLTTCP
jgi:hypothetical protein